MRIKNKKKKRENEGLKTKVKILTRPKSKQLIFIGAKNIFKPIFKFREHMIFVF